MAKSAPAADTARPPGFIATLYHDDTTAANRTTFSSTTDDPELKNRQANFQRIFSTHTLPRSYVAPPTAPSQWNSNENTTLINEPMTLYHLQTQHTPSSMLSKRVLRMPELNRYIYDDDLNQWKHAAADLEGDRTLRIPYFQYPSDIGERQYASVHDITVLPLCESYPSLCENDYNLESWNHGTAAEWKVANLSAPYLPYRRRDFGERQYASVHVITVLPLCESLSSDLYETLSIAILLFGIIFTLPRSRSRSQYWLLSHQKPTKNSNFQISITPPKPYTSTNIVYDPVTDELYVMLNKRVRIYSRRKGNLFAYSRGKSENTFPIRSQFVYGTRQSDTIILRSRVSRTSLTNTTLTQEQLNVIYTSIQKQAVHTVTARSTPPKIIATKEDNSPARNLTSNVRRPSRPDRLRFRHAFRPNKNSTSIWRLRYEPVSRAYMFLRMTKRYLFAYFHIAEVYLVELIDPG